jgi:shikimate dehydrogenase
MAKVYGLIGRKLGHSYSKMIHERLYGCDYRLIELEPEALEGFIRAREFAGLNVTIPYKQAVVPLVDRLTAAARRIGSVNTLYFDPDGALTGDNTDYYGLMHMLQNFDLAGRRVAVLGAGGGTGRTAACVLEDLGAQMIPVSRGGAINHENLPEARADYLINATPVGMYPDITGAPADPAALPGLLGVADVVYNPVRTALLQRAQGLGLQTASGLLMLVYQAAASAARFLGAPIDPQAVSDTLGWLAQKVRGIALIGMPGSGKTTTARALARRLDRPFFDTDEMIEAQFGPIPQIFEKEGEARFRQMEAWAVRQAALTRGAVVATGGGAVLSPENRTLLRANMFVIQLERPLERLSTRGRPLSTDLQALERMYRVRQPIYEITRDAVLPVQDLPRQTVKKAMALFLEGVRT